MKRSAIAMELAEMAELQKILIQNEQRFATEISDTEIKHRFQNMLSEDEKNMTVIESVMVQFGVKAKPRDLIQKMIIHTQKFLEGDDLKLFQKVGQHELMKHNQVMTGMLIHKCSQVMGADVALTINPINFINMENQAHQEQLKGVIEVLGTREITGCEPDQGLWGRVQDAVSSLSGLFGNPVSQSSVKQLLDVRNLIRLDHKKIDTLFSEINNTDDNEKLGELFSQLYQDLICHAKAEKSIIYPAIRNAYGVGKTKDLFNAQLQMENILKEIKELQPSDSLFMEKLKNLQEIVEGHNELVEKGLFPAISSHLSQKEQEQLGKDFLSKKRKIQEN